MSIDFTQDIENFHKKFGIEYDGKPRLLPTDLEKFRIGFMKEELEEYEGAVLKARIAAMEGDEAEFMHQMEMTMDALIDLTYVVLGTSHLHGFDFYTGWKRVHTANMRKERTKSVDQSKRSSLYDVVKPPGWEAPKLTDLVEAHAHQKDFRKTVTAPSDK